MQSIAFWGHHLLCNIAQNKLHKVRQARLKNRLFWGKGKLRGPGLAGEESVLTSAIIPQKGKLGVDIHREGSHYSFNYILLKMGKRPSSLHFYRSGMGKQHCCGERGKKQAARCQAAWIWIWGVGCVRKSPAQQLQTLDSVRSCSPTLPPPYEWMPVIPWGAELPCSPLLACLEMSSNGGFWTLWLTAPPCAYVICEIP